MLSVGYSREKRPFQEMMMTVIPESVSVSPDDRLQSINLSQDIHFEYTFCGRKTTTHSRVYLESTEEDIAFDTQKR